jgi:hypothetical protein
MSRKSLTFDICQQRRQQRVRLSEIVVSNASATGACLKDR